MKLLRLVNVKADLRETNRHLDRIATALEYALFGKQPAWMTEQPPVPDTEQVTASTEADLIKEELQAALGLHDPDDDDEPL